ncbi:PAAR domain-containing protein [Massilia forsythiae]|uniref:PAAR domain-containing protein n=1 Tax=Massilia forsythiae TaxID=2728020 RepID=A0A7Z2VU68_9BURK|nr:PAAR domain-containing protein [Massilia forsythiae]QJD99557.1 PAAR domain-containing protein [Massilia forsythiae]
MSRPLIVLGDKTSHGGTVISADLTFDIHGKYVARVGDMTVCPKCKGTFPITSGPSDLVDSDGNGYARHMDSTACGAKLISGQITTIWSDQSSLGDPAAEDKAEALAATSLIAASTTSGICLDCLLKAAATGSATVVRD